RTRAKALDVLASEFTPISDVRGSAEYRRQLVTSLLDKFHRHVSQQADEPRPSPFSPLPSPPAPRTPDSGSNQHLPVSARSAGAHDSRHLHVTGEALYADDQTATRPMLEVWPICSPHAHAAIIRRDATAACRAPGVRAILLAEDIPGLNDV